MGTENGWIDAIQRGQEKTNSLLQIQTCLSEVELIKKIVFESHRNKQGIGEVHLCIKCSRSNKGTELDGCIGAHDVQLDRAEPLEGKLAILHTQD